MTIQLIELIELTFKKMAFIEPEEMMDVYLFRDGGGGGGGDGGGGVR